MVEMISSFAIWMISVFVVSLTFTAGNGMKKDEQMRKIFCENLEKGLKEEYLECYDKLSEKLRAISSECNAKVLPSSNGEMKAVMEECCKDETIWINLEKCCDEHAEEVKVEMAKNKEDVNVKVCFDKLEEKYQGLSFWD